MSFLEFKTLRFDKQFGLKNGKIFTDNEKGSNAIVVLSDKSEANFKCAYNFLIENNSELADIFKGTRPMEIQDLELSIIAQDENFKTIRPGKNTVYTTSAREDGYLSFKMDGRDAYFNHTGVSLEHYLLGHWNATREFKIYINRKLNQVLGIDPTDDVFHIGDILFTGEIYGFIRKDGKYNLLYESTQVKEWKNVSMTEVGIKKFYDIIEEDIRRTGVYVDTTIHAFWKLHDFLKESDNVYILGKREFEDVKNVKIHALYDKLYRKGKMTLVPGEDSKFLGYYITHGAKIYFGGCGCGGYFRMTVNTFLGKEEKERVENYGVEITPIRKKNLVSESFTLKFDNDIENPRVFYEGDACENIDLIKAKDRNYIV